MSDDGKRVAAIQELIAAARLQHVQEGGGFSQETIDSVLKAPERSFEPLLSNECSPWRDSGEHAPLLSRGEVRVGIMARPELLDWRGMSSSPTMAIECLSSLAAFVCAYTKVENVRIAEISAGSELKLTSWASDGGLRDFQTSLSRHTIECLEALERIESQGLDLDPKESQARARHLIEVLWAQRCPPAEREAWLLKDGRSAGTLRPEALMNSAFGAPEWIACAPVLLSARGKAGAWRRMAASAAVPSTVRPRLLHWEDLQESVGELSDLEMRMRYEKETTLLRPFVRPVVDYWERGSGESAGARLLAPEQDLYGPTVVVGHSDVVAPDVHARAKSGAFSRASHLVLLVCNSSEIERAVNAFEPTLPCLSFDRLVSTIEAWSTLSELCDAGIVRRTFGLEYKHIGLNTPLESAVRTASAAVRAIGCLPYDTPFGVVNAPVWVTRTPLGD
jgi:hypothetical protein